MFTGGKNVFLPKMRSLNSVGYIVVLVYLSRRCVMNYYHDHVI